MNKRPLGLAALLTMSVSLSACLSGDGGSSDDGGFNGGGSTGGGSTDGSSTSGGSTGGVSGGFFNDDNGLSFANNLGASMSRLFNAGSSGSGGSSRSGDAGGFKGFVNRARESETVNCDSGSVTAFSDTDDATGNPTGGGFTYNNCVSGGVTATGGVSFTMSLDDDGSSGSMSMTFSDFTSTENGETASINGTINVDISDDSNISTFTISGPSLELVDSQGALSFRDYNMTTTQSTATGAQTMSVSADITDASGTISMDINPAFTLGAEDVHPASGVMAMTHSDGTSLTIDADNGDPDTFNYTLSDGSAVSSGIERWDNTDLMFNDE